MKLIDIAVITGAGKGIGKATALNLGKMGIFVLCISKSQNAENTKNEIIKNNGKADFIQTDLYDYQKSFELVSSWFKDKNFNKIGVALAASDLGEPTNAEKFDGDVWDRCLRINVTGNLSVLYAILPIMIKSKFGRIVFFAGGGAAYSYPLFSAYSASKTAVVRTVENLNEMLKDKGDFAISALAPGAVETDMLTKVKSAGAEVRTTVDIKEPVNYVTEFLNAESCGFSGSFVHVRDIWKEYLNNNKLVDNNLWKLRRTEK